LAIANVKRIARSLPEPRRPILNASTLQTVRHYNVRVTCSASLAAASLRCALVHPNKTLRRLVNCKLVRWKDRAFEILDRDELAKSAIFDVRDKHPRPFI
jgi:hypothetical protein